MPLSMMPRAITTNHRPGNDVRHEAKRRRHAFDRKDEARQQHVRQHRAEQRAHHRDALRRRPRRHEDAEGQRHEDEERGFGQQQEEASSQWHAEHETCLDDDRDRADEADDEIRRDLADDDLPRLERRHQQRLHRPRLLLARQRDGGHHRRDDGEHKRHQARHEEVRAFASRVEAQPDGWHDRDLAASGTHFSLIARDDRLRVRLQQAAGVGLGGVGDDQELRGIAACEIAREPGPEHDGLLGLAGLKQRIEIGGARDDGDRAKHARRGKAVAQRDRRVIRRRIHHREAHVVDVGPNGKAEQHDLHDRQRDEDDERAAIAQDVERLLSEQSSERPHWRCPDS